MCVSGGDIFCLDLLIFYKAELPRMVKIRKTLIMAWAVEKHCLEINVIIMQYMSF